MAARRPYGRRRPTLSDVAAVRSILAGESVIDWHRLDLRTEDDVERLLRVNEFDLAVPDDLLRLERLREEAVDYLERVLELRLPADLEARIPAPELLLVASGKGRRQLHACMILKVMHILYHLDGHELQYRLPVSADELAGLAEAKVVQIVDELRTTLLPIREFSWSRKSRDSLITKLLAKRDTFASRVYDRLRFRVITEDRSGILPLIWELQHRLIPFNYVIPGETVNNLLTERDLEHWAAAVDKKARKKLASFVSLPRGPSRPNEFSSPSYRIVNFVADLPVRVESFLRRLPVPEWQRDVVVTFMPVEFQIADAETAKRNDEGDSSHEAYKARQLDRVMARLSGGVLRRPKP